MNSLETSEGKDIPFTLSNRGQMGTGQAALDQHTSGQARDLFVRYYLCFTPDNIQDLLGV